MDGRSAQDTRKNGLPPKMADGRAHTIAAASGPAVAVNWEEEHEQVGHLLRAGHPGLERGTGAPEPGDGA